MHVGENPRHLARHVQRDLDGDALPNAHATVPHLTQILAFHHLHGDVEFPVHLAGVEGIDQRRMAEAQHHLGLVEKALSLARVAPFRQDLLDHAQLFEPVDLTQGRHVNLAHPTLGHRAQQQVLAEAAGEVRTHGVAIS